MIMKIGFIKRIGKIRFILLLGLVLVIQLSFHGWTADVSFYTYRVLQDRGPSNKIRTDKSLIYGNHHEKLFSERRKYVEEICDKKSFTRNASEKKIKNHLIMDEKHKLIYCTIEKNGCTFWKRMFQILNGFKNVSDPFDTKALAAYGGLQTMVNMPFYDIHNALTSWTKFIFVRDPYERLFSGYVDKIFSPYARYWFDLGRSIVKKYRQNSSSGRPSCGDDVTFEEFIRYYVNSTKSGEIIDDHFSLNYENCRPCEIKYDYIAKMENFKEETMFLIERLNLTDIITFQDFESETEHDAILQAIAWEFHVDNNVNNCTTKDKVLLKNYKKLQIRGFISKDIPFPFPNVSKIEIDEYRKVLLEANANSGPREKRKLNRKEALLEAYGSLSKDLLQELQDIFSVDAELFGYAKNLEVMKTDKPEPSKYQYFGVQR